MINNFAHRGFSGKYPENTMLAFEKALETKCDGIELDVHISKDGELVIIHDEKVNRTTLHKGKVKDLTFEELSGMDASYKFRGQFGINPIPSLRQYLELVKGTDIITNIELKTNVYEYPGIEQKVYDMIKEYEIRDQVIISSFNHFSVMRMKELDRGIECGLLTESWLIGAGKYTVSNNIECFHPVHYNLNDEVVGELKENGVKINTWTVNGEATIRRMIDLGVDTIIGNNPDLVYQICRESNQIDTHNSQSAV